MEIRLLTHSEIPSIWTIDRSEVIEHIYYLREGELVLESEHWDIPGWPPNVAERWDPIFQDCFERGGHFWGAFEGSVLRGITILESEFIGNKKDILQLKYLHVSHRFRKQGLGNKLFLLAAQKARELGARKLYISATPSENTVNFYMRLGCVLAIEVDRELFELEPEDIHLEFDLKRLES